MRYPLNWPDTHYYDQGMMGFPSTWEPYDISDFSKAALRQAKKTIQKYESEIERLENEIQNLKNQKLRMKYDNEKKEWVQL